MYLDSYHVRRVGIDGFYARNLEFRRLRGRLSLGYEAMYRQTHKQKGKKSCAKVRSMRAHYDHILALFLFQTKPHRHGRGRFVGRLNGESALTYIDGGSFYLFYNFCR